MSLITYAQKDSALDKYKFRTLSEITLFNRETTDEILKKTKLEDKTDFIGIDLLQSRVRVQFTEKSRPISESHQALINQWKKLMNVDEKVVSFYKKEFLFKECEKEYWIPVPEKIGESLGKKLKSDEMTTLFVVYIGGRKEVNVKDFEWLFLVTEFEK